MPSSMSCHMNGASRHDAVYRRCITDGFARPWDGPLICRLVFVRPGWAAVDVMPQPAARLRRSSSRANISTASFDWP
ncbi:hypothetical protein C1Y40_05763 [Mycobacterium talmoniae]|uniref:Uncharacterized protein n=1 Tax=Mycobacterium talmoniae TaxID=1858794 RepID=A0A2S8BBP9_9MYCO|nr:hypothetical protein C1Y40_05763 [Mycobacterium talmoniae]